MKKSEDTFDDHKVYKEKLYNNSNGDPLGVCLNGKSKDYLQAHVKLRDLLKKGKIFDTAYRLDEDRLWKKGQIKILNVVQTKTIVDATVQVIPQDGSKGNVQVKSHNPSNTKKKGATTELRKLPDHDFGQVLVLKSVLTNVLDGLIAGVPLEEAISKSNKVSDEKVNYHCEFCNYESKSKSGLKIHVSRIHRGNEKHCTLSDLKVTSENNAQMHEEMNQGVDVNTNKCNSCDYIATIDHGLKKHEEKVHCLAQPNTCENCNCVATRRNQNEKHQDVTHKEDSNRCDPCEFKRVNTSKFKKHVEICEIPMEITETVQSTEEISEQKVNTKMTKNEERKRQIPSYECQLCGSTFDSEEKLAKHTQSQHTHSNDVHRQKDSPSSSPSRKKIITSEDICVQTDVEMTDMNEIVADIQAKLEARIEELEKMLLVEKTEKERIQKELDKSEARNKSVINSRATNFSTQSFKIPKHLRKVHDRHLSSLHGFKMRYCSVPDGACLTNCLTAHISCTEDEEERKRNNRKVNEHIADNYDNHYKNKIALPYIETVGVGEKSRRVKIQTRKDFLAFLRSEESLCAFANSQELFAICNMFNINIWVFTFVDKESEGEWRHFGPDPDMAFSSHFPPGWIPDMYLYNYDQVHYDLLVAEDHHLALLGLIATNENRKEEVKEIVTKENLKIGESNNKDIPSEAFLTESDLHEYDDADLEELDEEVVLAQNSKNGYKRVNPSTSSERLSNEIQLLKCTWKNCKMQLESQGLLSAHMKEHKPEMEIECEKCEENFLTKRELETHMKTKHTEKEWNCNGCCFQGSNTKELINHLKLSGHQPSQDIQNSKIKIIHCYTCKEEFSSYWNLMNHRRQMHPSNRICRYFLKNACIHGVNCWYRHDEPMEIGSTNKTEKSDFQLPQTNPLPPESQVQTMMKRFDMVLQKMHQMEKMFFQKTQ